MSRIARAKSKTGIYHYQEYLTLEEEYWINLSSSGDKQNVPLASFLS